MLRVFTCAYLYQSLSARHHTAIDAAGLSTCLCYSLVQLVHSCYTRDTLVTYGRNAMRWYNNARRYTTRFSYYMYTCVITMLMTCNILWVQRHYMLYLLVSLRVLLVQRSAALLCNSTRLYNSCCILAILTRWSRSLLTGLALL